MEEKVLPATLFPGLADPEPSWRLQTPDSVHSPTNTQCIPASARREPLPPQPRGVRSHHRWVCHSTLPAQAHLCSPTANRKLLMLVPERVSQDVWLALSLRKLREACGVNEVVTALLGPWWLWHLGHIWKTAFPFGCPLVQTRKVKWLRDCCEDTAREVVPSGADVCDQPLAA